MQTITVQKLHEQFSDFLVVDVREQWEWDNGHIDGSVLFPLKDLQNKFSELDKNRQLAVFVTMVEEALKLWLFSCNKALTLSTMLLVE